MRRRKEKGEEKRRMMKMILWLPLMLNEMQLREERMLRLWRLQRLPPKVPTILI